MSKQKYFLMDVFIVIGLFVSSGVGVFYSTIRFSKVVENVYGDAVTLFGRGLYAYESAFQGPIFVGTDIIILATAFMFVLFKWKMKDTLVKHLLEIGLLTVFLYYSASLAFGTMMNRLFLIYVATFGLVLFRLVHAMLALNYSKIQDAVVKQGVPKGLQVFIIVMALSVSVWFLELIPLVIEGQPSELIGVKATEPTYIFDLAIVAPVCVMAFYGNKQKRASGVVLSTMMVTLLSAIGLIVISQTLTQAYFGIEVGLSALIIFVYSFTFLSAFAVYFLIKLLQRMQDY